MSEAPASPVKVVATISFYMVAAIVMVTVNKWVLVETTVPAFFICCQLCIAAFLIYSAKLLGIVSLGSVSMMTARSLWQVIGLNTMGLLLGNFTLRYVDASFYQVARGLILPITVVFAFYLQAIPPSRQAILSCVIVTMGFFVGTGGSLFKGGAGGVTMTGVIFGLTSSIVTAYHSMTIKRSLSLVSNSAMDLSFYSNFFSAIAMFGMSILIGEGPELLKLATGEVPLGRMVWGTLVTGLFGFLISLAGLLSVKVTSPVTHMVSSAVRGVLQTLVSVGLFGDVMTTPRVLSILIIIAGSCHYVWAKSQESAAPAAAEYVKLENVEDGGRRKEEV